MSKKLTCRIHGPNQIPYIVCMHIVRGELCKDIVVEIDEGIGEAVCEREHWDYEHDCLIGDAPEVLCEGCAMAAVNAARERAKALEN